MSAEETGMRSIPVVGPWPPEPGETVRTIPATIKPEPAQPRRRSIAVTWVAENEWRLGPASEIIE